jgi:wobble nucleotide-excising tRNase
MTRNRLKTDAFSQIENLPEFLALKPKSTADANRTEVEDLRRKYDALNTQKNNSTAIKERKLCSALTWAINFSEGLRSINQTLESSLETHHEEARAKVAEHISTHFAHSESAESWIRTGLSQNNGVTCQFCSQPLGEQAKQLLEVYKLSFDTSYEENERMIKQQLASFASEFRLDQTKGPRLSIETNNASVLSYPELREEQSFIELQNNLNIVSDDLQRQLDVWDEQQSSFITRLEKAIHQKEQCPNKPTNSLDEHELAAISLKIGGIFDQYNSVIEEVNKVLQKFKDSVDPDALTVRLNEIETRRQFASRVLQRLELSEQVERYISHESTITKLGEEIPRLESDLRAEQSTYLDQFFGRLNHWFDTFGSHDFNLERGEDRSGHTPVYFLRVKYCGESISEKDLDRVFSESDRRTLALTVFWSSLSILSPDEQRGTIVVLDDPVTSFDNNRITAVHQEIARMADTVRQVIILSHYDVEVAKFLSTYKDTKDIGLIEIQLSSSGSTIKLADIDYFIKDEHARKTSEILNFISGETGSYNVEDLRIFLEKEINYRFAQQISNQGLGAASLGEKIARLREGQAISNAVASEADDWRINLNPDHHTWTSTDIEDQRRTAGRFMDFVYLRLTPLG